MITIESMDGYPVIPSIEILVSKTSKEREGEDRVRMRQELSSLSLSLSFSFSLPVEEKKEKGSSKASSCGGCLSKDHRCRGLRSEIDR